MSHMIRALPNGKWSQNCYIVSKETTKFALVIDPGSDAAFIKRQLLENDLTPVAILNTHAHYDHIGAVSDLMEYFKIPFYLNPADVQLMKQANIYKFLFDSKESVAIPKQIHELPTQNAVLNLSGFDVSILCTPGHTKGSICMKIGTDIFSGDTLLPSGPGRTDLPGGDRFVIAKSVDLLRSLPDNTMVWPGHGLSFLIGSLWKKLPQAG
jgi:hydroxyacylglutathione hydrolase